MKYSADITINVTAHAEGILLHKTLRSIWAGYEYAHTRGIKSIEFNISLDRADSETTDVADRFAAAHKVVKLHRIDVGDLGKSRNFLIGESKGKYIVFFDGDDFFTENYIYEAFQLAEKNNEPAVYSPAFMVNFEAQNYILPKLETKSAGFKAINLFETNYFISQNFVSHEIYQQLQYEPNTDGYGMEDWHWNTRVVFNGYHFYNVPNTIFFYRRKIKGSLIAQQSANKALLRRTPLFEPANFLKQGSYHVRRTPLAATTSERLPKRIKKSGVRVLRRFLSGDSLVYRYLREQYIVNRSFAGSFRSAVRQKNVWSKPQHNADLYHDPLDMDSSIPAQLIEIGVDEALIAEWAKLNAFEPMIRPSKGMLDTLGVTAYPETSVMSTIYYDLCKQYGSQQFTDIVFVPHLVRGGADLAAINLIKALANDLGRRVLVFTTEGTESPWANMVRDTPGAELIEFRQEFLRVLDPQQIELMIAYLVKHWDIERVSVVNSAFGYNLAEYYGRQLRENTKLYLYTYAFDMTPDGFLFNYLTNGLVNVYPNIDRYFTDSKGYCNQLVEINGFDSQKIQEIYLPAAEVVKQKRPSPITRKVLWASRISKDKLLEVAVATAVLLEKENIEMHFYGSMDTLYELGGKFNKMISGHRNIVYHGSYEGFHSLPVDDYDIFLLTSKNEGMPNVILEAIMANLFVVAPRVGGLPEVIVEGKNGLLLDEKFNPQAYADKIIEFYKQSDLQDMAKRSKFNRIVLGRHNWQSFVERLKDFY